MSVLAKFETEHAGCVVQNMPLTTAGGFSLSCDVVLVPKPGWAQRDLGLKVVHVLSDLGVEMVNSER